jgi:hypothetical protein
MATKIFGDDFFETGDEGEGGMGLAQMLKQGLPASKQESEQDGVDRFNGKRGSRGPKKFVLTYEDWAKALGVSVGSLQVLAHRGKLDLGSPSSIIAWLASRKT